jgi:hypothetical protein
MHIDANLVPIFAIAVGLIITVTAILTDSITKYKLKVEQIKADALVRVEEVRAKNQLELEKLMKKEQNNYSNNNGKYNESSEIYDEENKPRSRIRE